MDEREQFSISDVVGDPDSAIVSVTGEIDMEAAPSFTRGLLRALGAGKKGLIVDLTQASFMDSTALTSLVGAFDQLRRDGGGNLAIVAEDSRLLSLFEVARMERDFEIYGSREEALAAIGAR